MSQRCACQGLQELDLQPAERAACNVDAAEEQQAVHELLCSRAAAAQPQAALLQQDGAAA